MESMFGLTYAMRNKLVQKGILSKHKLGGKMSKSFYKYDQVIDQIEKGKVTPSKMID